MTTWKNKGYAERRAPAQGNLNELVRRYHWRKIGRIRAGRRSKLRDHSIRSTEMAYCFVKRALDIAGAGLLMLLTLPIFMVVAVAIKLTDRGPILFWQDRTGYRGTLFPCPKFRSMVPDADKIIHSLTEQNDHGLSITFKMKLDPRVTWVGRIIRRFSIDELPQLWCVLTGKMTLVGPRPALPREVTKYRLAERRRLDVKPGLTCFWQVNGRGDLPFAQQLKLDVDYIESRNLVLDLKLLIRTVPAVLLGRGAY
jgi:lipopolysaccharide/colanic/teichoic acid biosynthesis glycosyltransferase